MKMFMERMFAKSVTGVAALERGIPTIIAGWVIAASLVCGLRLGMAGIGPETMRPEIVRGFATYALVVANPAVFMALSLRWFSTPQAQPAFRLARLARWRDVTAREATAQPLHGLYATRNRVVEGQSGTVRVDMGVHRIIKNKYKRIYHLSLVI